MMLSSLRRIVLMRVAYVLRRMIATVEPEASPLPPPPSPSSADPRRPAPPAHWVELVQQYAPHLLDPAEPDATPSPAQSTESNRTATAGDSFSAPQGNIVDYRTGAQKSLSVTPQTNLRPVPLTPRAPRPVDVPQRRPASKRPLRLDQVSTRPLEAVEVLPHSAQADAKPVDPSEVATTINEVEPQVIEQRLFAAEQIAPPLVQTTIRPIDMGQTGRLARLFSAFHLRRRAPAPAPAQPVRAIPTQTSANDAPPLHFAPNFSFEQQRIRKIDTTLPNDAAIPTIHTNMGQAPQLHQGRTGVPARPSTPSQTVLRPTLPSLNLADVTPDRWPALPDEAAEAQRDPLAERQRRERLKREQEGGTWNE